MLCASKRLPILGKHRGQNLATSHQGVFSPNVAGFASKLARSPSAPPAMMTFRVVKEGSPVGVVNDGAFRLLRVLFAKEKDPKRIIAMSRHASRQKLAREFGATDIVIGRSDEGVARIGTDQWTRR